MFDQSPSFRISRRKPDGHFIEIEVRASLLRWLLATILILTLLARGVGVEPLIRLIPAIISPSSESHAPNSGAAIRQISLRSGGYAALDDADADGDSERGPFLAANDSFPYFSRNQFATS